MRHMIEYGDYMPHGMCLLWQPWLVVLWAGSDLLIFLSYMAIPLALITVLRQRKDVPHPGLVMLFASFILLCGLTHLAGIVTLWWPIYPWIGALKLVTGIVSAITAVVLFRLVPTLVALPSPGQLGDANRRLQEEIAAHQATLATLEDQVDKRTEELRSLNANLAVQAREAVHRSGNLLSVVSSLASQSAKDSGTKEEFVETLLARLRALAKATTAIKLAENNASEQLETLVRDQLTPLTDAFPDRVTIEGPAIAVGSEAAQQIALALHELATNAQKYNLSESDDTRVALTWKIVASDTQEDRFELNWQESLSDDSSKRFGSGEREGFGTKLLTRIVPAMLRGNAVREFGARDFSYCLDAPLASVMANTDRSREEAHAARLIDENFGLDS